MDQCLVVYFEAAGGGQRTDSLLHSPSLGQQDEAFGEIRPFDNLYDSVARRLNSKRCSGTVLPRTGGRMMMLLEARGFELTLCTTLTMTRRRATAVLRF